MPLALALLAALPLSGQAWIVDAQLGPGAHFAAIQPAVDAAAAGDLVLVRSGQYAGFALLGKSLSVCADSAAVVDVDGPLLVRHVAADERVLIQGLRFTSLPFQAPSTVELCAGPIWLERCAFTCLNLGWGQPPNALRIRSAAEVALIECSAKGSTASGASAGHGLTIESARVLAFQCAFEGGSQGPGATSQGGAACRLIDGELEADGSSFTGGTGSSGAWFQQPGSGPVCISPGDGGHGLVAVLASAQARAHACVLAGGPNGAGVTTCTGGVPGAPIGPGAGQVLAISAPQRSFGLSSPVRGGGLLALGASGPVHEWVWVAYAAAPLPALDLGALGFALLAPPLVLSPLGPLAPTGSLGASLVLSSPGAGLDSAEVWSQALFVDPLSASARCAAPAALVLLDAAVP